VPQLSGSTAADGAPLVLELAVGVAHACWIAVNSGKLATVLQGSDSVTVSLVSNHLLALLATCLKVSSKPGSSAEAWGAAFSVAGSVCHAGLDAAVWMEMTWMETTSNSSSSSGSSSSSQATISRCGTAHWLFLVGRSVAEVSQRSMQVLAARLGLLEGELPLSSAADAAAVIRAAACAATRPGAEPRGGSHDAAPQRQVDDAAATAAGMGLILLCDTSGTPMPTETADTEVSVQREVLQWLHDSLAQLAEQQQQQAARSSCATEPPVEQLQQLAKAASDVMQQLDSYCSRALHAAASCCKDMSGARWDAGFVLAVLQGCDGVTVLRDSQGQPTVRQHALLNVLHHAQRLQRLGEAVCAAVPPPSLACANPACDNVSGLSDMQLVWRRGVCGHCRAARFCSAACLRSHWKHRDPGSLVAPAVLGGGGSSV
jgi:hypothetical protein